MEEKENAKRKDDNHDYSIQTKFDSSASAVRVCQPSQCACKTYRTEEVYCNRFRYVPWF